MAIKRLLLAALQVCAVSATPDFGRALHPHFKRFASEQRVFNDDFEYQDATTLAVKPGESPLTKDFQKWMTETILPKWHVPGMAVGVVDGNDTWTAGYGLAALPSTPVTPHTLFEGGSTTKAFTASILGILISSGNYSVPTWPSSMPPKPLSWRTPIHSVIPDDFVLSDDWATHHVTFEDALSHRTGMARHDLASAHIIADPKTGEKKNATIRDTVRMMRHLPLAWEPRVNFGYCNHMFAAVALAIETLTNRTIVELLEEYIWQPLGMNETVYTREDALNSGVPNARGHSWRRDGDEYVPTQWFEIKEGSGAGGVVSNVVDYTKWIRMLLRREAPLPMAVHEAIKTPRMFDDPNGQISLKPLDAPVQYAFGWGTSTYRGHRYWSHAGGTHAFGTEICIFPDLDFGIVTFGNTAQTSNLAGTDVVWRLVDDKLDVPVKERFGWTAGLEDFDLLIKRALDQAVEILLPKENEERKPALLPFKAYTGTYYHPAYLNISFSLTGPDYEGRQNITLVAYRTDSTWPCKIEMEHVSGEWWMAFIDETFAPGISAGVTTVRSRTSNDGKATAMGMTLPEALLDAEIEDRVIWFDKIA